VARLDTTRARAALMLISDRSRPYGFQAMVGLQSRVPGTRLLAMFPAVLDDGTEWTQEERDVIFDAATYEIEGPAKPSRLVAFRLRPDQHEALVAVAAEDGMTVSDYIRVKLGL
jgi:hypothetical protein